MPKHMAAKVEPTGGRGESHGPDSLTYDLHTTTATAPNTPDRGSTIPLNCPYLHTTSNQECANIIICSFLPETSQSVHSSGFQGKTHSQALREILKRNAHSKIPTQHRFTRMRCLGNTCWNYLAFSKVAVADWPMAPNPTPTANPSVSMATHRFIVIIQWQSPINAHLECCALSRPQ